MKNVGVREVSHSSKLHSLLSGLKTCTVSKHGWSVWDWMWHAALCVYSVSKLCLIHPLRLEDQKCSLIHLLRMSSVLCSCLAWLNMLRTLLFLADFGLSSFKNKFCVSAAARLAVSADMFSSACLFLEFDILFSYLPIAWQRWYFPRGTLANFTSPKSFWGNRGTRRPCHQDTLLLNGWRLIFLKSQTHIKIIFNIF